MGRFVTCLEFLEDLWVVPADVELGWGTVGWILSTVRRGKAVLETKPHFKRAVKDVCQEYGRQSVSRLLQFADWL